MKTSFVFSPKELPDCEDLQRFQSFINSVRINEETAIDEEYLPLAISYLKELMASVESAVRIEHPVASKCYNFNDATYTIQQEKELIGRLNDLAARILGKKMSEEDKKHFNMDGFYPYYTQQPLRILFVGREACWMSNMNYIETLLSDLKEGKVGSWSLNQYPFHKRQFYMAYGILSAVHRNYLFSKWDEVPWADEMAKNIFAKESGNLNNSELESMSWAFMNMSKISNDTGDWRTDDRRYRPYVDSHHDEIKEEIRLLQPDLIIGANVYDLVTILGYNEEECDRDNSNCYFYSSAKDGVPPFLNCYHFSAIKNDRKCFYEAVASVLSKNDRLKEIVENHKKWEMKVNS